MRLLNDVAIVTGAARGIGSQIARCFAEEGARVIVADLDEDRAQHVAASITATGGMAIAAGVDITAQQQVERLTDLAVSRFGKLDVLVNNAGVGMNQPLLSTTLEQW